MPDYPSENLQFQSSLPAGGATDSITVVGLLDEISILAPRGGSDFFCRGNQRQHVNFNPRSPRGERPRIGWHRFCFTVISILAPRGGSDVLTGRFSSQQKIISILAPRGGSDYLAGFITSLDGNFNPRSPRGERHRFPLWQCLPM